MDTSVVVHSALSCPSIFLLLLLLLLSRHGSWPEDQTVWYVLAMSFGIMSSTVG